MPENRFNALESAVFRLNGEPCRRISDLEAHRALMTDPAGLLRFLAGELAALAAGDASLTLPEKQVYTDPVPQSDFRSMGCVVRHGDRVWKAVKVVGTNGVQRVVPDQITVGRVLALDAEENFVSHIFDACLLSSARTGACAALAARWLAPAIRRVAIVGCGRVGYYCARYLAAGAPFEQIRLHDVRARRARALAALLQSELGPLPIRIGPPAADDDLLVLATTSARACCHPRDSASPLVISLGADIDDQSELDPAWAEAADIFVDTRDSLRFGDLKTMLADGRLDPASVRDLFDLLRDPPEYQRRRLFVSTGSALFDTLTVAWLMPMLAR